MGTHFPMYVKGSNPLFLPFTFNISSYSIGVPKSLAFFLSLLSMVFFPTSLDCCLLPLSYLSCYILFSLVGANDINYSYPHGVPLRRPPLLCFCFPQQLREHILSPSLICYSYSYYLKTVQLKTKDLGSEKLNSSYSWLCQYYAFRQVPGPQFPHL